MPTQQQRLTLADDILITPGQSPSAKIRIAGQWHTLGFEQGNMFVAASLANIAALEALREIEQYGLIVYLHLGADGPVGKIAKLPNGELRHYWRESEADKPPWRAATDEESSAMALAW